MGSYTSLQQAFTVGTSLRDLPHPFDLPWPIHHTERAEVAVGNSKQGHEYGGYGVMEEDDGDVSAWLYVTQEEQRDE